MAFNVRELLGALRTIDSLFAIDAKFTNLLDVQKKRLDDLTDRINRLEAREQVIVAEARGASAAAASAVAASHIGESARIVGGLAERVSGLEGGRRKPRLPPPEGRSR